MPYRIAVIERTAVIDGLTALFNKGANPNNAVIQIYSNATSQPATPETAIPGGSILLATIPFSSTAFAAAVTATGIANGLPISGSVIADGTPAWFRFLDGQASPRALGDGSITLKGSGGDMTFNNLAWVSGGSAVVTNLSITEPM